jgi:hypothetical protein
MSNASAELITVLCDADYHTKRAAVNKSARQVLTVCDIWEMEQEARAVE